MAHRAHNPLKAGSNLDGGGTTKETKKFAVKCFRQTLRSEAEVRGDK